jgi:hypothetical protein
MIAWHAMSETKRVQGVKWSRVRVTSKKTSEPLNPRILESLNPYKAKALR